MHDDEAPCETARLAQTVESAEWLRDSVGSSGWACPTCQRLAAVVLPYLRMVEARLEALERRQTFGVRGPGRLAEAVCQDCQRTFVRRSVLRKRCDACRKRWKDALNRVQNRKRVRR